MPETETGNKRSGVFEIVFTIAVTLCLALAVEAYAVKPYRIPSPSMEPTLNVGQRVLVNRLGHHLGGSPSVGDVIVFHPPKGAGDEVCGDHTSGEGTQAPCRRAVARPDNGTNYIKRVVAVGGDHLSIVDGHAIRNGAVESAPYIEECGRGPDCNFPAPITIPKGYVFMMGDNRGESDDSRFWGPVPKSWVVGRAFATYWPPKRIGGL